MVSLPLHYAVEDTHIIQGEGFMGSRKGLVIFYRLILIIMGILGGLYLFLRIRLFLTGYTSNGLRDASLTVFKIYKWGGYTAFILTFFTLKSTPKAASFWRAVVMTSGAIFILMFDTFIFDPEAENYMKGWAVVFLDMMCCYSVLYFFTSISVLVKTLRTK